MNQLTGSKRILFASIGSLGDLHPCLALALELRRRGHEPVVASTPFYREKVEGLGLEFHPLQPDWDPTDGELIRRCDDLKRGPEILIRELILPHIADTFDDLLRAAERADMMVAGELNFAAPLVAEKLSLRWASAILSPASFFSSRDPSLMVNVPWLMHLRKLGWPAHRFVMELGRMSTQPWAKPVRELRRKAGLRVDCDPIFRDKFAPELVLALFSPLLAAKQLDWPKQTLEAGFVFFDQAGSEPRADANLETFLSTPDAPLVFTQGSTAVHSPGEFYRVSAQVAKNLGRRALLIGASDSEFANDPALLAVTYAPFSEVFPRAAVIVHQGGSGTTGQALAAGRPQLIVPFGWDQPDNAMRVARLSAGIHLPRAKYTVAAATEALTRLVSEAQFAETAARIGGQVRNEDGLNEACDTIEALLR